VPAMKILGALSSTSNPEVIDLMIGAGALNALRRLLTETEAAAQLRKDSAWILSNIAAGNCAQAQKLLDEPDAYNALQTTVERGPTNEVRCECAWALVNLARQGAPLLARMDCRELLRVLALSLASVKEPALQQGLLDAAAAALRYSAGQAAFKGLSENPLVEAAEASGFLETLEQLQHSESEAVYRKAVYMLEKFFGADGENYPPEAPTTPSVGQTACKSPCKSPGSSIVSGSRAGYKFGA